ncbi:hypothetical protein B0H10DRAFT_2014150 [Mycena sp. CBHHK59/15]|nr:hypothetical protein B0H10DRAFT_2014150 [Mycena sp. CBHHK59/15]
MSPQISRHFGLSGSSACLTFLFLSNTLAYAQCVNGVCPPNDGSPSPLVIFGIVVGIVSAISIVSIIFACVRRQRIQEFQRTYVANAQANANVHMFVPTYPAPVHSNPPDYAMQHHSHRMNHHNHHHNHTIDQINLQNNLQNTTTMGMNSVSGM